MIQIAADKKLHFLACALAVAYTAHVYPLWIAALIGIGAGIVKELIDWLRGGRFCWADMVFNIAGVFVALVMLMLAGVT